MHWSCRLGLQCFTDVVERLGLQSKVDLQVTLFASWSNLAAVMGVFFVSHCCYLIFLFVVTGLMF